MKKNILKLKKIGAIINAKSHFFVDTYQRGYKWDKQQVKDLLNDINSFEPKNISKTKETFYWLQPVVVKQKNKKTELIDGQQRMTTIFIILSYLKVDKFYIDYQTRKKSEIFLNEIISKNKIECSEWEIFIKDNSEYNNIDNFHFFNAYNAVKDFFKEKNDDQKTKFLEKLINNTKVIWYEVVEGQDENEKVKSQELFARINIGKIPLTNSELIKALFLSDKNIDEVTKNEIAMEWDIIENTLQNDDFWYFISDGTSYPSTRIDLIFDIISNKDRENKKTDELFSFRFFNENNQGLSTIEYWHQVTQRISLLQDWFDNIILFHLIGYCIETSGKNKLRNLVKQYYSESSSEIFLEKIESDIENSEAIKNFNDLQYGSYLVKNILLLFNIKTYINISNKDNFQRFPFNSYKKNKWSVEHIHAQNSLGLNQKDQWDKWLEEAINGLENISKEIEVSTLIKKIKEELQSGISKEKFEVLFKEIQKISSKNNENGDEIHSLDNLALLDGNTNSSISNNIFAVKRNMIIEAEKNDFFIPICTKNVFLKYYSKSPKHIFYWSSEDREDYLESMRQILGIDPKKTIKNEQ